MMNFIMLEDDLERIERFQSVLRPQHCLDVSRTAWGFIDLYQRRTETVDLICLDHDLFTDSPDDPDPGDGRDVSRFLATEPPLAPVLIHSTNADAADSMLFSLRDAHWDAERIAPIGADWIEDYWYPTVVELLRNR